MAVTKQNPCTGELDIYKKLPHCKGKRSYPGLRPRVLIIRKKNILTWPVRQFDAPADYKTLSSLKGDFVLDADKKWADIALVPDENSWNSETVGAHDSQLFNITVELAAPGTEEEVTGLVTALLNDDVVFLIQQRNGKFRLVGSAEFDVKIKVGQSSGKKPDDEDHTTNIQLSVFDSVSAPFYTGKIETEDGDISGADGSVLPPSPEVP